MKRYLFFSLLFIATFGHAQISYDGFYIAKTGKVEAAGVDIFTYLRFYKDGTVYSQAVTANEPQTVAGWFGRFKTFSQKGTYKLSGQAVDIQLSNKGTKDVEVEGLQETTFKGTVKPNNQLCMTMDKESKQYCFEFSNVLDTTKIKYSTAKPEVKLPGDWKIKQILKNGQVFFTNEDSTIIAVAIFKASRLPVYKETQTAFESVYAFYEWDATYMKDEEKMDVKKIAENKEKVFITWNAKDKHNDNYFLFARNGELMYNIMIYDTVMPLKKKLGWLETIYYVNKE